MGTRRLTLLRHGEAQAPEAYAEDFERPLTRRGGIEAREMGTRLVHRGLIPDLILVSPAERAWSTAEIVAAVCEMDPKQVQCARELYLATAESILRLLGGRQASAHHVLICGHNPGLSQLASRLGPHPQRRDLSTAGVATALLSNAGWHDLQPELAEICELDDPESMADLWA